MRIPSFFLLPDTFSEINIITSKVKWFNIEHPLNGITYIYQSINQSFHK